MARQVGVVAKTQSKEGLSMARKVYRTIENNGMTPLLERELSKSSRIGRGKPLGQLKADLIITLGGDGTVLKTVREMPDSRTPILAVNLGRRGYLTEVEPDAFEDSFDKWLRGDFQIEEHWRISVLQNGSRIGECLNEALLLPRTPDKMVNVAVNQNGKRIIRARADGFMVATPTGSTAHSFSAGGPVLETSLDVLVLTLIAPLQPVKSLVVSADKKLKIILEQPGPTAILVLDGTPVKNIGPRQSLDLKRSPKSARFVRFGDTFLERSLKRLASERENA